MMNVTVGATSIRWDTDELSVVVLTALPIALACLFFQRRITDAVAVGAIRV